MCDLHGMSRSLFIRCHPPEQLQISHPRDSYHTETCILYTIYKRVVNGQLGQISRIFTRKFLLFVNHSPFCISEPTSHHMTHSVTQWSHHEFKHWRLPCLKFSCCSVSLLPVPVICFLLTSKKSVHTTRTLSGLQKDNHNCRPLFTPLFIEQKKTRGINIPRVFLL